MTENKLQNETPEKAPSVKSNVTYFFCIISLIISGICFTNIIDYWIEDHFFIPINDHYGFSRGTNTYAYNISLQIIASFCFVILFFIDRHLVSKNPSIASSHKRKKSLTFLIIIFSLIMVMILTSIIYSYFSGKTEPYGLLRASVVLLVLSLGIIFFYTEMTQEDFLTTKAYKTTISGTVFSSLIVSIIALQAYGSPALMRDARADLKTNQEMNNLLNATRRYYSYTKVLPRNLNDVANNENLNMEDFENITYTLKTDTSFQICSTFKRNWQSARRLKTYWNNDQYTQGENCRSYHVRENRDNSLSIEIETRDGTRVKIQ